MKGEDSQRHCEAEAHMFLVSSTWRSEDGEMCTIKGVKPWMCQRGAGHSLRGVERWTSGGGEVWKTRDLKMWVLGCA